MVGIWIQDIRCTVMEDIIYLSNELRRNNINLTQFRARLAAAIATMTTDDLLSIMLVNNDVDEDHEAFDMENIVELKPKITPGGRF